MREIQEERGREMESLRLCEWEEKGREREWDSAVADRGVGCVCRQDPLKAEDKLRDGPSPFF